MAQGGPLGVARGARGELDIDGILRLEAGTHPSQHSGIHSLPQGLHGIKIQHAGGHLLPEPDHHLQGWQTGGGEPSRRTAGQFGGQLVQHGEVIASLEGAGTDEGTATHVVDGKLQLVTAIGGIDANHDDADASGGKLHQAPLYVVR